MTYRPVGMGSSEMWSWLCGPYSSEIWPKPLDDYEAAIGAVLYQLTLSGPRVPTELCSKVLKLPKVPTKSLGLV